LLPYRWPPLRVEYQSFSLIVRVVVDRACVDSPSSVKLVPITSGDSFGFDHESATLGTVILNGSSVEMTNCAVAPCQRETDAGMTVE